MKLYKLFRRHAGWAFHKNFHLDDLREELPWQYETRTGRLRFGDRYDFRAEFLGSESDVTDTWLWSWANKQSDIPEELTSAARAAREYGYKKEVKELVEPQSELFSGLTGHHLSAITSGLVDANAFFVGEYEDGRAFLLIRDPTFPTEQKSTQELALRIAFVFPQLYNGMFLTESAEVLEHYLVSAGFQVKSEPEKKKVTAFSKKIPVIKAHFKENGDFRKMKVLI